MKQTQLFMLGREEDQKKMINVLDRFFKGIDKKRNTSLTHTQQS